MFEIQEAAKVITESIDPSAKVIFGTVRDEKLKKNEIRVTVIASGFPESVMRRSLFGDNSDKQGKMFTVGSTVTPASAVVEKPAPKTEPVKPVEIAKSMVEDKKAHADEDDDWGAVPAFLRRSKLK
jgi:cell division protein FtsZ